MKLYPDKLEFHESISIGFIIMDIFDSTEPLETRVLTLEQVQEAVERLDILLKKAKKRFQEHQENYTQKVMDFEARSYK